MKERVTLKPGDYVSTAGMTEVLFCKVAQALKNAGAKPGFHRSLYSNWYFFGWCKSDGLYFFDDVAALHGDGRHLTIDQVLTATNAGGQTQDTLTTILESAAEHDAKAKHHADEHERLMQQARDMLPDGWRLVRAEDMPDGPSLTIVDGQDMSDPANWREGDYIVSPGGRLDVQACAPYKIESFDGGGDPRIKDDSGRIFAHGMDDFRFHHRPNT